jgi:hypothetical protein
MPRRSDIHDLFPAWSAGHFWDDAYGGSAAQRILPWLATPYDGDDAWDWNGTSSAGATPTASSASASSAAPTSSSAATSSASPSSSRSLSSPAFPSTTRLPSHAMASPSSSAGTLPPFSSSSSAHSLSLSRGAIIGLACGGGAVLLCIAALLAFCVVHRRRRRRHSGAIDISAPWQPHPNAQPQMVERTVPPVRLHSRASTRSWRPAPLQLHVQMQHEEYVHRDGSGGIDEEALQEVLCASPAGHMPRGGVHVLGGDAQLCRSPSADSSLSMGSSSEKSITHLRPLSLGPAPRSPASRARVSPRRCSTESTSSISLASPALPPPALTHSASTARAPARPLRAGARTPPPRDEAAAAAEAAAAVKAAGWRLGTEPILSPRARGPITFAPPLRSPDVEAAAQQREAVVTARRIPLSYFLSATTGAPAAESRAPSMRPGDRQVFPLPPNAAAHRESIASTSSASSGAQSIRASGVHAQLWLSQEHSP